MSNAEDLYKEEQQQRASSRILQVVGLLALVVGGVGIANITVAAIVERTREIGLRRALGATDLEVMFQFIAEAAMLSCIGGAAAILVVHGVTKTATNTLFEVAYVFQPADAALSMGAAFVVGIGASFFPALRVTRIDVVQALRGE
jgi:putative ABC transport system permease protein